MHGGFAPGQHQAVKGTGKVCCLAQLNAVFAQLVQTLLVLDKGALNGKNGTCHGLLAPLFHDEFDFIGIDTHHGFA